MHCARSYHRGAIKKRLSRTVNEAKLGHLRSAIERSHDRTIPRYAGTEPSGGRSIPLSPHLRPNRLKPSTIESITCDDNTLDSTRFNDDIVDDHLLFFLPFLSFPKETLSISPLIRSHRGKTRFGHICATITLPDSMLEITSFRRFLDDHLIQFPTLNTFPIELVAIFQFLFSLIVSRKLGSSIFVRR